MLEVPDASLEASEICCDKNKMHILIYIRIIVNDLLQAQKQMNDILRDDIRRRRLRAEDKVQRTDRFLSSLDLQILVYDVQRVHLLALVLMQPLDLNVKDSLGIQLHAFMLFDVRSKSSLVMHLNLVQL